MFISRFSYVSVVGLDDKTYFPTFKPTSSWKICIMWHNHFRTSLTLNSCQTFLFTSVRRSFFSKTLINNIELNLNRAIVILFELPIFNNLRYYGLNIWVYLVLCKSVLILTVLKLLHNKLISLNFNAE